jgi:lysophospholipid acyltransferase (LPLAT)-like uncharacterized protein
MKKMKPESIKKSPLPTSEKFLLKIIPLVGLLLKLLLRSCRVINVKGRKEQKEALLRSKGRAVYVTWHQRISHLFFILPQYGRMTVMISKSRDGEYADRLAKWNNFKTVRGSSTRGGTEALKEITQKIMEGSSGGMLADGPTGPARVAKMGSVIMARDAGVPIIPILWGSDRCRVFSSWDRFMLPKPFARIVLYHGDPIWIPSSAKGEELEGYRRLLEERLNEGARWCDEHFGRERPWRKVKAKRVPDVGPL